MKLLRYGLSGQERPGLLDSDGRIRDLSLGVADIGPDCPTSAGLVGLAELDPRALPLVDRTPRMGVQVAPVGRFIAIMTLGIERLGEQKVIVWQRTGRGPTNGL
jgi:2,4-didehydro-3-deoxy-L-rhamnonate hydrolase